jgi:hypothetical protein
VAPEHRLWLSALATRLNGLEPGWGGPAGAAIISSPFTGTRFDFQNFVKFISRFQP